LFTSIQTAKSRDGLFDRTLDCFNVGSIRLDRDGLSSGESNRFDYGFGCVGVPGIRDGYICSIGGQALRNCCANAPGTAGNECHFIGQLRHRSPLLSGERFTTPLIQLTATKTWPVGRF
jgi:hypothetical protein